MKPVVSMLVRMSKSIFYFMLEFERLSPSERTNLISVLLKISNLPEQKAEQVLTSLTKWIKVAPTLFLSQSHRLLMREPIDEMIRELDLILNILKDCNYDSVKSLEKLKSEDFSLYSHLFELSENYWESCKNTLEKKDLELSKKFNKWMTNLAGMKENESWETYITKTTTDFQRRIEKLFLLEGQNFSLFQDILELMVKDQTTRTMFILGDIYNYFPAGNLKSLIEQLKLNPEIIFNLFKVFPRNEEFSKNYGNFSSQIKSFIMNIGQMDAQILTCILKGDYTSSFDAIKLSDMMTTYKYDT
jgi:hypothetical protein